ncbi:MAG TPA: PAS domain-containing sensor histidine kinase [Bryobacteraceae bacterium]|nr:PAS domain-containing sensor histidine kinase [Bryobacteraceae bacterium]
MNNSRAIAARAKAERSKARPARVLDELARERELLQKILDHIPVLISLAGRDGHFQWVNRQFERTLGWRLEEVINKEQDVLAEIFPDPQERDHVQHFLAEGNGEWADFRPHAKDGRVLDMTATNVRLSDGTQIGISHDITDRKCVEEQLKAAGEQLRALAREEERTRIAREIHDELGSALTSLRWDLEGLDKTVSELEAASQIAGIREKLRSMLQLADATFDAVRRIASELRPIMLDDLGLVAAMESQAQELQARTGIRFDVVCSADSIQLSAEKATAIFRIFQEALTNVVRHSRASQTEVVIEQKGDELVVLIRDDGQGITPAIMNGKTSLGFLGMRERARLLGGKVDIQSIVGQGTTVRVRVPV